MTKLFRNMNIVVLLMVGLLCLPAVPSADQAQYIYDDLGRLSKVIDGQGNVATYTYGRKKKVSGTVLRREG